MGMKEVAIVGAGMCGLTLSSMLSAVLRSAVVLEKSKGVGGRLATRRDGDATYDHGAAFYVDSDSETLQWHPRWQENEKAIAWYEEGQRKYFCGVKGMTVLAKDLAEGQNILLNEKVTHFRKSENGFQIFCESGKVVTAQKIVLTCPLPQSLQILSASKISFPDSLKNISYAPAIVGLFELEADPNLYNFNLLRPGSAIFTIANNQAKGISKNLALTIVMNDFWSEQHFNLEDAAVLEKVKIELKNHFKGACKINKSQIKKWRYSQPKMIYPELFIALEEEMIFLAGDAFGGGSIAGAVRSAKAVFPGI